MLVITLFKANKPRLYNTAALLRITESKTLRTDKMDANSLQRLPCHI